MNYAKSIFSCFSCGLLICLAGCTKRNNYEPRHLQSLKESAHVDYQETKDQVTVQAKVFTENDCNYLFGERVQYIREGKNPLRPIQLCIENNGSSAVKLIEPNISLPLVSASAVSRRLSNDEGANIAQICCSSGVLATLAGIGLLASLTSGLFIVTSFAVGAVAFATGISLTTAGTLLVVASPFVYVADSSNQTYQKDLIDHHIRKTSVGDTLVINPGKTVDTLLFVYEKKYQEKQTFDLTLLDQCDQQHKLKFTVKLDSPKLAE